MPYGRLNITVTGDTRPLEREIARAAAASGEQAAASIGRSMASGLKATGSILSSVGKAASTGLTVATTAAVGFGVASFRAAARVGEMNASLKALAAANKLSYPEMQKQVGAIRRTGIEAEVAQDLVAQFARNNLDLAKSTKLARVAQDLAVISGRNSTEVLSDLTHGIMTNNTQVLRNAGSNVMAGQALAAYAKQLGKNQNELSATERAQAVLNAVIEDGSRVAGAYESAMQEPGKVLRSFRRVVDDIKVSIGEGLVRAFGPAILASYQLVKSFSEAVAEGGVLYPIFDAIGAAVGRMTGWIAPAVARWDKWIKGLRPEQVERITAAIKTFGPAVLIAAGALATLTAPALLSGVPVLGQALSALTSPATVVAKQLGSIGVQAVSTLVPGLSSGGAAAGTFGAALGSAALPVVAIGAAIAVLAVASGKFRAALMVLARSVLGFLAPVISALVFGFKQVAPPIWEVVRAIGDALAPVISRLAPLLVPLGRIVGSVLRVAFILLGAALKLVASVLVLVIQGIGWLLDKVLLVTIPARAFLDVVARWASVLASTTGPLRVVASAVSWLTDRIALLVRWITGGSPGLIPAFLDLQRVVGAVVAFVRGTVVAGFGAVASATSAAFAAISAAVASSWSAVRAVTAAATSAVAAAVSSAWAFTRSTTATVWAQVSSLIAASWSNIRAATASGTSQTVAITSTAWTNARNLTTQLWGQIANIISAAWRDIVTRTRAAGGEVINGLKAGMSAAIAGIGGWLKSNIVDPIINAIKGFFGIHSPSTVMAAIGEFLVKGLFKGMIPGITGIGNIIQTIFGGWPEALAGVIAKGLIALAGLPGKALDAIMKLFGSGSAEGLARLAQTYEGHRYVWGGGANPNTGFDCSSFVNMLAGMLSLPIPGGFRAPSPSHGPVTTDWLNFSRMSRVPIGGINDIAVNGQHMGVLIGPGGAGFAARSTATGTGRQNLPASAYTHLRFPSAGPVAKVAGWLQGALGKISGMFGSLFGGTGGPTGTGQSWASGVAQWGGLVTQVLGMLGRPDLFAVIMSQLATESGGNQRAINLWDSNARAGTPSKGLMQVIDPTFARYAGPFASRGIWDPLANIYAGVSYALSRYGARVASVLGRGRGYALGGVVREPVFGFGLRSGTPYTFGEAGPELVSPLTGPAADLATYGGQGITIHVYPQPGQSEVQIAAAVSRELAWAQAGGRA